MVKLKSQAKINELELEDLFILPGWISDDKKIEEIYRKVLYIHYHRTMKVCQCLF